MRRLTQICIFVSLLAQSLLGNGVLVKDAALGKFLSLQTSRVEVSVEGQISITKVTNIFRNNFETDTVKFAYPLSEQASATGLKWKINGIWYIASMAGTPTDTSLPGTGGPINQNLKTYLGKTPMYFEIPQIISADSQITLELTYVELLPYKNGKVTYQCRNDYRLIQSSAVNQQDFQFFLTSQRQIDSISVQCGYPVTQLINNGSSALVQIHRTEQPASSDYGVQYSLNSAQLGLFGYSTYIPFNQVPDSLYSGFFSFIAEPDPSSTTAIIRKVFTLIIDRSGSMTGTKMEQAKNAAKYIVQNLNEGDKYNLIDFDDIVTSFRPAHVPYTTASRDSAYAYINQITARNLTSISGAFAAAIPQFSTANDSTANIIIFLTDGVPTAGITDMTQLIEYVSQLVTNSEKRIMIYNFGIGNDVNSQLLTLISSRNRGFAQMLGNDELYSRLTEFYNTIRNPVLLNPRVSFTPNVTKEIYPDSLPNLYKGTQLILAGRYSQPGTTQIVLSGDAFGHPVNYQYNFSLADSEISSNKFLLKIWAKKKIETLLIKYYSLPPGSSGAIQLKEIITYYSIAFGVLSPLTSFSGGTTPVEEAKYNATLTTPSTISIIGNYPNPFNPSTTIEFQINNGYSGLIEIRIFSITGELIKIIPMAVNGSGYYSVIWDGTNKFGNFVPSGTYFCVVSNNNQIAVHKMILMK